MDVRVCMAVALSATLLAGCSKDTKYTKLANDLQSAKCTGSAANQSRVIVEWMNGQITTESVENVEDFKENFLKPKASMIKHIQFDQKIQLISENVSSNLSGQTRIEMSQQSDSWGQQMIQLDQALATGYTGQGIAVGVVDSFVDIKHPQLSSQILYNKAEVVGNEIDDDGNGYVDDYAGLFLIDNSSYPNVSQHGTHVSGIIAADPQKGPMQGVAPGSKIIPAQFLDNSEGGNGSLSNAIKALDYVVARGAKVINASWGGAPCVDVLASKFSELSRNGILLVVASGNDGLDLNTYPNYPAAFNVPTQITVAASSEDDFMLSFSNVSFDLVHIAAPGYRIMSTIPAQSYATMSGTSMSAPFVSGAAALLWSARPQATAEQIKQALLETAEAQPLHEFRVSSGGRLNVYKALVRLTQIVP